MGRLSLVALPARRMAELRHEFVMHATERLVGRPSFTRVCQEAIDFGRSEARVDKMGIARPMVHGKLDYPAFHPGRK